VLSKTITRQSQSPYNIPMPDFSGTSYKPGEKAGETKQHHSTWRKMVPSCGDRQSNLTMKSHNNLDSSYQAKQAANKFADNYEDPSHQATPTWGTKGANDTHVQETKICSFPIVSLWWGGPDNRACSSESHSGHQATPLHQKLYGGLEDTWYKHTLIYLCKGLCVICGTLNMKFTCYFFAYCFCLLYFWYCIQKMTGHSWIHNKDWQIVK